MEHISQSTVTWVCISTLLGTLGIQFIPHVRFLVRAIAFSLSTLTIIVLGVAKASYNIDIESEYIFKPIGRYFEPIGRKFGFEPSNDDNTTADPKNGAEITQSTEVDSVAPRKWAIAESENNSELHQGASLSLLGEVNVSFTCNLYLPNIQAYTSAETAAGKSIAEKLNEEGSEGLKIYFRFADNTHYSVPTYYSKTRKTISLNTAGEPNTQDGVRIIDKIIKKAMVDEVKFSVSIATPSSYWYESDEYNPEGVSIHWENANHPSGKKNENKSDECRRYS